MIIQNTAKKIIIWQLSNDIRIYMMNPRFSNRIVQGEQVSCL